MKPNGLKPVCEMTPCPNRRCKTSVLCLTHHNFVRSQIDPTEWLALKTHWGFIHAGCTNPHSRFWRIYGAYGFTMTLRWNNFMTFLLDMNTRPDEHHRLKLKPGATEYNKENCYWGLR